MIIFLTLLSLSGCALVTPKFENKATKCKLTTKSMTLKVQPIKNHYLNGCRNEGCVVGAIAPFVISGIVSGSIYTLNNTIHWIEEEGRCDEGEINKKVTELKNSLVAAGGWTIDSLDKMLSWMSELPFSNDENTSNPSQPSKVVK